LTCSKCGAIQAEGSRFCSVCGNPVLEPQAAAPAVPLPPPVPAPIVAEETSGKAVASLICGIINVFPFCVVAIILGHISLSQIGKSAGRLKGRGLAIAGLVTGYLGLVAIPFNLTYATPSPWKPGRASQLFTAIFRNAKRPDPEDLARYFQIRRLWETGQNGSLTRADRDLLRAGDKQYKGEPFESGYQKWFAAGLSEVDLDALFGPSFLRQEIGFGAHLLPDSHDFLSCQNARPVRPSLKNARSTFRSASRSRATALQPVAAPELPN
jgi:hypothetical protein